jgi:hypothetical protein
LLALPLAMPGSGVGELARPIVAAWPTADPVDTQGNPVGVDGSEPTTKVIGEQLLAGASDPGTLTATAGPAAQLPMGPLGIPGAALDAYVKAAASLARTQPGCHLDWSLLASIGRIESNHARGGNVDAAGTTRAPILGPVLNGGGFAAIADTDGGVYDGDSRWDRAVGPMQFIPSTWRAYAADGNGDGRADPSNIYDATVAAGRYLCAGGLDTADPQQRASAVFRYNHSDSYVATVLLWADAYARGVHPSINAEGPVAPLVLAAPAPLPLPLPLPGQLPAPPAPVVTTAPPATSVSRTTTKPPSSTTTTPSPSPTPSSTSSSVPPTSSVPLTCAAGETLTTTSPSPTCEPAPPPASDTVVVTPTPTA